ncbi:MAG: hypothetical protein GC205_02560 [Bacteroidetes bacterium]|nr:hypothetical protein [Bacteroidota bacterium]
MKVLKHLALSATFLAAAGAASAQCTAGSTLIVGPADQYAFQWCNGGISPTAIGLNFASSVNEYQFKKLDGTNVMTINPTAAGYIRLGSPSGANYAQFGTDGDLGFQGTADYLVGNNRYAFRSQGDQDNGLFFNVALNQYEFRDNGAVSGLAIKANLGGTDEPGDIITGGSAIFEDEISAAGSGVIPAIKGVGLLGPTNGYLGVQGATDFDGIVGLNLVGFEIGTLGISTGASTTDNYGLFGYSNGFGVRALHSVSGFSANLATPTQAAVFNGPVELNGLTTVAGTGFNNAGNIGLLKLENATSSLGFDGNEVQSYNSLDSAGGTLFLNFFGGNVDIINGFNPSGTLSVGGANLHVTNVTDRVGIGTTSPSAKLHVLSSESVELMFLESTGSPTEMFDINRTVAMTSGQDIIDISVPTGSSTTAAFFECSSAGAIEFQVNTNGHMGVGTTASSLYAIQACGSIRATEVVVETGWCDYVFEEDYRLAPLSEVESFIKANKHLPGIPSAAVVESEGVKVAEMSSNLMLKVEELTLYTIEQEKQINSLQKQIEELKALVTGQK